MEEKGDGASGGGLEVVGRPRTNVAAQEVRRIEMGWDLNSPIQHFQSSDGCSPGSRGEATRAAVFGSCLRCVVVFKVDTSSLPCPSRLPEFHTEQTARRPLFSVGPELPALLSSDSTVNVSLHCGFKLCPS